MRSFAVSKARRFALTVIICCIWILYHFTHLTQHAQHAYAANPWDFLAAFDLITIHRTNFHSKGLQHWYEWLGDYGRYHHRASSQLTLLHFDAHAHDDGISAEINECSPAQFFQYDQFVSEVLGRTEDLIDNAIDADTSLNVTADLLREGFFSTVVWLYPDHWTNFSASTSVTFGVHYALYQKYARHQTYFVSPMGGLNHKFSVLQRDTFDDNATNADMHSFWSNILFRHSIETTRHELDAATSVRVDILALPISALLSEPFLSHETHRFVLDVDLDVFLCQSPADSLMERFEWDASAVRQLNTLLSHHQYQPSHIPGEQTHTAMLTLIRMLSQQKDIPGHDADSARLSNEAKVPKITEMLHSFAEHEAQSVNEIRPLDVRQSLHFLYRLQLELGGDFVQPMSLFLATHRFLDELWNEEPIKSAPYSARSGQREEWHAELAKVLSANYDGDAAISTPMSSATVEVDGSVREQFMVEEILTHLQSLKAHFASMANTSRHRDEDDEDEDDEDSDYDEDEEEFDFEDDGEDGSEHSYSEEDVLDIAMQCLDALEFSEHAHKISSHRISEYLNASKRNSHSVDMQNLTDFIASQKAVIWNPKHDVYHEYLRQARTQRNEDDDDGADNAHLSYSSLLSLFEVSSDYRYHEWPDIVDANENEPWTADYIQHSTEPFVQIDPKSTFEESQPELTARDINKVLSWHKLDKVQQHFLQKADHRALKRFLLRLSEKQSVMLQWLMFCFVHPENCEEGHHPFDLFGDARLSKIIFGQKFEWDDLIRMPSFVDTETEDGHDLLQLRGVSLGPTEQERVHRPSKSEIKEVIGSITQFLSVSNFSSLVSGGVEVSRAHIPKAYLNWVECELIHSLRDALHQNTPKSGRAAFLRYQHFEDGDSVIEEPMPKCLQNSDVTSPYI